MCIRDRRAWNSSSWKRSDNLVTAALACRHQRLVLWRPGLWRRRQPPCRPLLLRQPRGEERPLRLRAVAARGDGGKAVAAPLQRPAPEIVGLEGKKDGERNRRPAGDLPPQLARAEQPWQREDHHEEHEQLEPHALEDQPERRHEQRRPGKAFLDEGDFGGAGGEIGLVAGGLINGIDGHCIPRNASSPAMTGIVRAGPWSRAPARSAWDRWRSPGEAPGRAPYSRSRRHGGYSRRRGFRRAASARHVARRLGTIRGTARYPSRQLWRA